MNYSIIIPVYRNQDSIPDLLVQLDVLTKTFKKKFEVIFVVDGSPDKSFALLNNALVDLNYSAQILVHSRNFGSFAAIRSGLAAASGKYFAIIAADLQEPPDLVVKFFKALSKNDFDIILGTRINRNDPFISMLGSKIFWILYKKFIIHDLPIGGVDVFACNSIFKNHLLNLEESRSSLIGLIFWLGFRRKEISYVRQKRKYGKSAWTLNKKIEYLMDSFFSFTDFPIKLLINTGIACSVFFIFYGFITFFLKLMGFIKVSGYTTLVILIAFTSSLNLLAFGLVGSYAWRAYENTKNRPLAIIANKIKNNK